jgi:hypothetical protein
VSALTLQEKPLYSEPPLHMESVQALVYDDLLLREVSRARVEWRLGVVRLGVPRTHLQDSLLAIPYNEYDMLRMAEPPRLFSATSSTPSPRPNVR